MGWSWSELWIPRLTFFVVLLSHVPYIPHIRLRQFRSTSCTNHLTTWGCTFITTYWVNPRSVAYLVFFIPKANSKNGRPWQIINIKTSLSFIEFRFIFLSNLKFECKKSHFSLKIFFCCLCVLYCPGRPHHSPRYVTPLSALGKCLFCDINGVTVTCTQVVQVNKQWFVTCCIKIVIYSYAL